MPKYISGRVKRTPQTQLTDDRYQYLGLEQTEPNLGDPPTATGTPNIPIGQQYQVVSVLSNPGERYWIPIGGGLIPGSISVFDEDTLVGSLSSITQLNFVGLGVTADAVNLGIAATITITPPGDNGSVLFKERIFDPKGDAGVGTHRDDFNTSSDLVFNSTVGILTVGKGLHVGDTGLNVGLGGTFVTVTSGFGSVGIATTDPTQELHLNGDLRLEGTIYDFNNQPGSPSDLLVKGSTGIEWQSANAVRSGAGGTIYEVQYHNTAGLVDGAPKLVYTANNDRVGIGSTQPTQLLDVLGVSTFNGGVTIDRLYVTGLSTFLNLIDAQGAIKANSASVTDLTTTRVVFIGASGELVDDSNFTYDTTTDVLNVANLTATNDVSSKQLAVTGVSTLGSVVVGVNSITTTAGALILNSFSNTVQVNDNLFVNESTQSDDKDTGALVVNGGVGIEKNLNVGGQLSVVGVTTLASSGGITTTGGALYVGGDLFVKSDFVAEYGIFQNLLVSPGISTFKGDVEFWGTAGVGIGTSAYWDKNRGSFRFLDNSKIEFGTGSIDLSIYSVGTQSIIESSANRPLYLKTSSLIVQDSTGGNIITATENKEVTLFHNKLSKLTTLGTGVTVTGQINASTGELASGLVVQSGTTNLKGDVDLGRVSTNNITFNGKVDSDIIPNSTASYDLGSSSIKWRNIYAQNILGDLDADDLLVTGIATFKDDVEFWGNTGTAKSAYWDKSEDSFKFVDDAKLILGGDTNNLKLYHSDDGNSYIQQHINAGISTIFIEAISDIVLRQGSTEPAFVARQNGPSEIYYDGLKRSETFVNSTTGNQTQGISVFGYNSTVGGGVSFLNATNSYYMNVRALAGLSSNYTLTLPPNDGSSGDLLKSDGSGNLDWIQQSDVAGSPGGTDSQIQYNNNGVFGGASYLTYTDSGASEGDVTFTGDTGNVYWDRDASSMTMMNGSSFTFGQVGSTNNFATQIYGDGNGNGYWDASGNTHGSIYIYGRAANSASRHGVYIQPAKNANSIVAIANSEVSLYNDGNKRFETTNKGVKIYDGIQDKNNKYGDPGQILSSTSTGLEWIDTPSGSVTTIDVKLDNYCGVDDSPNNPISVTPTSLGITTVSIGSSSNAYGRRFVQATDPTTSAGGNHTVCDGDIWYDTSG